MKLLASTRIALRALALLAALAPGQALAARHALLIGNDNYQSVPILHNARADADAMGQALRKAGYQVTVSHDRSLKQMKDDVRQFKAKVRGGDEVVVFYSGHGVQIEAMNYLLPVDVRADSEDQVKDDGLALSKLLDDLRAQKPAFTLAVIDACRDNPFTSTGRAIGGRGLTGVAGASGQMVIYSAGEGQQALDRLGDSDHVRNGVFTRVFIKEMEAPGVPIDQVARRVREQVNALAQSVKHEQVPAIYDQVIGQFFFYQPAAAQAPASPAPVVPLAAGRVAEVDAETVELLFWESIKNSNEPDELRAYLEKYPSGNFAGLAKARIRRLEQRSAAAPAAALPAAVDAKAQEQARPAADKPVADRAVAEKAAAEKVAAEQVRQQAELQARAEAARQAAEREAAEKARLAAEKAAAEKAAAEKMAAEKAAQERARQAAEQEQARLAAQKAAEAKAAAEKAAAEKAAAEKARAEEQAKAEAAQREAERIAAEQEKARIAEEQARAEAARREAERLAAEKAAAEKLAAEKAAAEKARLEAERAKAAEVPEEEPIF